VIHIRIVQPSCRGITVATDLSFIEYVADQARLQDRLTHKRMFGEYALYLDGKVVAFACDNSLFVKPADATRHLTMDLPQRPPYPGARPYPVADALLDEPDRLHELLLAAEQAMPAPKAGAPRERAAR
jgi:TfoX/Sxy family transcriptional regulator of competence genes